MQKEENIKKHIEELETTKLDNDQKKITNKIKETIDF